MILDKYKELLDHYTFDAIGEVDHGKSRYCSFKLCLDNLAKIENPEVLELGTTRSFVSGAFEGCNSDDPKYWNKDDFSSWDISAGAFTIIFGQNNVNLTTVDICSDHIKRCKIMTDSLNIKCNHVISDSLKFLRETDKKYDLVYLDTGDMWPIKESEELQLKETEIIINRNLLKVNGLILIDDVGNRTPRQQGDLNNKYGKSTLSLPFLLNNGFKVVYEGYQFVLSRM